MTCFSGGAMAGGFATGSVHDGDGADRHVLVFQDQPMKAFPFFPNLKKGCFQFGD